MWLSWSRKKPKWTSFHKAYVFTCSCIYNCRKTWRGLWLANTASILVANVMIHLYKKWKVIFLDQYDLLQEFECKRYITCFSSLIQDGIKMTVEPIVLTLVLVRVSQSTRCFIFIIGKNAEINVMKAVDTK